MQHKSQTLIYIVLCPTCIKTIIPQLHESNRFKIRWDILNPINMEPMDCYCSSTDDECKCWEDYMMHCSCYGNHRHFRVNSHGSSYLCDSDNTYYHVRLSNDCRRQLLREYDERSDSDNIIAYDDEDD